MVSTQVVSAILLSAVQITLLIGLAEGQRKARPPPTATEAKERERANFDCPEEFGYYPHPKDCTQYYVCVFGGALLESCTGGLMYSHELQTCDWPRNVGCDGLELGPGAPSAAPVPQRNRERSREREKDDPRIADSRTKFSPPPPPQPKAVVTSRGQPRQLQNQQDIIKQLYDAVEESLPPAEEIENDRQQRVYRGQPSTVGQVQRDRDGYRHSNVLPTREKIGVISFGTQSQLQHYSHAPDLTEILTNDLTTKKRHKRDAQRSRPTHNEPMSWHVAQRRYPQREHRNGLRQKVTLAGYENEDEFQPFIPNYAFPSNQVMSRHLPPNHFHPNSFKTPVTSATAHSFKFRGNGKEGSFRHHQSKYPINMLESAFSNVVTQTVKPQNSNSKDYARSHTEAVTRGFVPQEPETNAEKGDNDKITRDEGEKKEEDDQKTRETKEELEEQEADANSEEVSSGEEAEGAEGKEGERPSDGKPSNFTSSYEYHSNDDDDDELGPPPEFFKSSNKYENIYNPFEDPNFNFDQFLEKLGSTTTTTTPKTTTTITTTTTTTTPKPHIEESRPVIVKELRPAPIAHIQKESPSLVVPVESHEPTLIAVTDKYHIPNRKSEKFVPNQTLKEESVPEQKFVQTNERYVPEEKFIITVSPEAVIQPATPAPPIKPVNEELTDDYDEGRSRGNRKIYPIEDKSSAEVDSKTTTPEYEYYWEEYDYVEPNMTKSEVKNETGPVKYSAKYKDDPKNIDTTKKQSKVIYNVASQKNKPKTTLRPSVATNSSNSTLNLTPFTTSTAHTSGPFIIDTSDITTETPKSKKTKIPSRKRTTLLPTQKRKQKSTTESYEHDSRQEQSIIIPSEEKSPVSQAPISTATATARTLYNSSQYNNINQNDNRYDPFYALYDEDAEIYKDVDYTPQNNNYQTNPPSTRGSTTSVYRGSPAAVRDETPKRGNIVYNNVNQDIYQQSSTVSDYNDNSYQEEDPAYRQSSRAPSSHRGDRNEINDIEEVATTKRTSSTPAIRRSSATTAQARTLSPQKITTTPSSQVPVTANENQTQVALSNNTNPGHVDVPDSLNTPFESTTDFEPDLHEPYTTKLTPLEHLTTVEPAFHYITKAPKSTHQVSTSTVSNENVDVEVQPSVKLKFIVPTTYSPPKYLRKSLLRNSSVVSPSLFSFRQKNQTKSNPTYQYKTLKAVRKLINPISLNHELEKSNGATYEVAEDIVSNIEEQPQDFNNSTASTTTTTSSITTSIPTTTIKNRLFELLSKEKLRPYIENDKSSSEKHFSLTVEIPPPQDFLPDVDEEKAEPDQPPSYKPRPPSFSRPDTKTEPPLTASLPARVSRVNAAIKSLIAIGGTKGPTKCTNKGPKCKVETKQRTPSRGRGTSHYTNSASIASNEVTVNVNRGTPAPRSRPTLKPSTSIVSKASEFIDIYRNPPRRPDALYPQPQPDKTAAKCRKDVCLLPDCYCGGKDIPGDLPVEQVPQIVLLTFDDSVNDLNKGLYQDLFERGRTNPNGCPIAATFYVSHEWTDYSQVQNLYSDGHELASHTVSHSFGEQFSQKKWTREVAGQREILAAYGGVKLDDVKGMRAPFLSVGGNKMFKMLYDSNFTYDSSMPIYENKPPSWPYTLDYKLFHDCMIPPCPTRSYPGVWEVPMVMWQDLNGGRCSMGDACSNPPDADGVFKMLIKNFERHYTTNRAPFGLFYHAAWFTQPHHKEGFINFIDTILTMKDVWLITNWQALQWVRDPTPISRLNNFQPFQCDYTDRPKRCNNPKVCNLWHKSGVRYMRTCQPCPDIYPWTGNTGIRSSKIDNDIED